jgi:hypothetical protein
VRVKVKVRMRRRKWRITITIEAMFAETLKPRACPQSVTANCEN